MQGCRNRKKLKLLRLIDGAIFNSIAKQVIYTYKVAENKIGLKLTVTLKKILNQNLKHETERVHKKQLYKLKLRKYMAAETNNYKHK